MIAPASAEGGFMDSSGLMSATTESERQQLQGIVAQIAGATDGLASMLENAGGGGSSVAAVTVDNPLDTQPLGLRDSFDKEVHQVMWLVDMAVRVVKGAEPFQAHQHERLRHHVGELRDNVASVHAAVGQPSTTLSDLSRKLAVLSGTLEHLHTSHIEKVPAFRRWRPNLPLRPEPMAMPDDAATAAAAVAQTPTRIPWGLVFGVTVDAGIDGLLIGLANTASQEAGLIMALATSIEMAFLGLSFSATIGNAQLGGNHRLRHLGLIALPPAMLILAGVLAGLAGELLTSSPVLFVGLIGFSIVALLFLVTQELLMEAAELGGGQVWWISAWLFVGVFMVVLLERHMGGADDASTVGKNITGCGH